jgi:lipoprotein-releasing system ATP-binding protein
VGPIRALFGKRRAPVNHYTPYWPDQEDDGEVPADTAPAGLPARAKPVVVRSPIAKRTSALLRAQNVFRVLGSQDNANTILKGVDLSIGHDEYVSIVGASGSGKSTLLYLLGGLDRPTRGMAGADGKEVPFDPPSRVVIDGEDTSELNDQALAALRNQKIGFVFQFHYLLKEFTAQENVALPMFKLGRLKRHAAMERAAMLLDKLGLGSKVKRRANRLSGGEQQRVAVARALANEPAVLLADEPTGNLDRANGERVAEVFEELSAGGQTIVMVTHDLALAGRARRLVRMEDGRVIEDKMLRSAESAGAGVAGH